MGMCVSQKTRTKIVAVVTFYGNDAEKQQTNNISKGNWNDAVTDFRLCVWINVASVLPGPPQNGTMVFIFRQRSILFAFMCVLAVARYACTVQQHCPVPYSTRNSHAPTHRHSHQWLLFSLNLFNALRNSFFHLLTSKIALAEGVFFSGPDEQTLNKQNYERMHLRHRTKSITTCWAQFGDWRWWQLWWFMRKY